MKSIDQYVKEAQKKIDGDEDITFRIDDLVHDLKSREASDINNGGLRDQIAYIAEAGAMKDLVEILGDDLAANDTDPDRCTNPGGHEFVCTGTAYGGDDERFHGEGRCYCIHCGADGDA